MTHTNAAPYSAQNASFCIKLTIEDGPAHASLIDLVAAEEWSDAPYFDRARIIVNGGVMEWNHLADASVIATGNGVELSGNLGPLRVAHNWTCPETGGIDETITVANIGNDTVIVESFECGFLRVIADSIARVHPDLATDRLIAIPFRKRPTDPDDYVNDHAITSLLTLAGRTPNCNDSMGYGFPPSRHWQSEAWAWRRGDRTLAIMKFNQERIEYSAVSTVTTHSAIYARFGGVYATGDDGLPAFTLASGETITFGATRYSTVAGGYEAAAYEYRDLLDQHGCRFPDGFNPPVHWNELYDNPEWWLTGMRNWDAGERVAVRARTYTREMMEAEAVKARAYHCESLYLDPGWDTTFASFQWDTRRLGDLPEFVRHMREQHDLDVSLHTPLATWMSQGWSSFPYDAVQHWPAEAHRTPPTGAPTPNPQGGGAQVCLGSQQYRDEAAARLLALCDAGVAYLMFDGNWWNGGCDDLAHGHPVPYTREDHIRANVDLAQRIHARYPEVLIEMHDMLCGGAHPRATPVYYKYGLPGSYDLNWGFELMWCPKEDMRSGRAQSLYYYNLACNVPVYLHIDLRDDNDHATFFWWYASTCRHLGIGGTHENPNIANVQRHAMARYQRLASFYKRGDFYGISEEIHVHVLPRDGALVVNIFNLSDSPRKIEGSMPFARLGIADEHHFRRSERQVWFDGGRKTLNVSCDLPPWGHHLVELSRVTED
ncbi:MAG TPA: hypothetical protein VGK19_11685 [Capsulimonadaceae bacterium]|jgi:hypothetical protein